jgi:hypothetical protein
MESTAVPAPVSPRGLIRYAVAAKPTFTGSNFLLYLGSLVMLFSSYGLVVTIDATKGDGPAFGWSLALILVLMALVAGFYHESHYVSGGLLAFVIAAFTPVWMVTLERWLGYWDSGSAGFHTAFQGSWFLVELVTVAVALVALIATRFPLLGLVLAASIWYTATDNVIGVFLNSSSGGNPKAGVAIIVGLVMMGIAVFADETPYRLASFWLHLIGLTSFAGGIVYNWHDHDIGWVGIIALSVVALAVSIVLKRSVYGVFGAIGLLYGAIHFINQWISQGFSVSLGGANRGGDWKPWFTYVLVGLGLMVVGLIVGEAERRRNVVAVPVAPVVVAEPVAPVEPPDAPPA